MRNKWYVVLVISMTGHFCWNSVASAEDTEYVRIVPEEMDEILANPGMGWETFHKTANDDKNLPSWIPSTIPWGENTQPNRISRAAGELRFVGFVLYGRLI